MTTIEAVGDRQFIISNQGNGRNGRKHGSQPLSWYLAEPRNEGLSYALTANGYAILPDGLRGWRKGLDKKLLIL
jgi:hypothetical protein